MFTEEKPIELRQYQTDCIREALRSVEHQLCSDVISHDKYFAMICSVGSGKTLMAIKIAATCLSSSIYGIDKVLITTPQNLIMNGFEKHSEAFVKSEGCTIKLPYVGRVESTDVINSWISATKISGIKMCCINSIVSKNSKCCNPFSSLSSCTNILWVIDEAHHIDAKKLKPIVDDFKSKGGFILYLTATPYNINGVLNIMSNPSKRYVRTLSQQMIDGFCPKLHTEWVLTKSNNKNYYDTDSIAESILNQLIKDNFPKAAIILPSVRSGKNAFKDFDKDDYGDDEGTRLKAVTFIVALEKLLKKKGIRLKILNIVGSLTDDIKYELDEEIKNGNRYDLIVACRRLDEGVDITTLNAIYQFGIGTDRVREQRAGRVCRNKKGNRYCEQKHPDYLGKSKFVIFLNDVDLSEDDRKSLVGINSLRTIFSIQNLEAYERIINLDMCQNVAKQNIKKLEDDLKLSPNDEKIKEDIILEEHAAKIAEALIVSSIYPNEASLFERERLSNNGSTIKDALNNKLTKNIVLSEIANSIPGEELHKRIKDGLRRRRKKYIFDPIIDDPIISSILCDFKDTLLPSGFDENSQRLVVLLSGENIKDWSDLFDVRNEKVFQQLIDFRKEYKYFPRRRGDNESDNYLYDLFIRIRKSNNENLTTYLNQIAMLKELFGNDCLEKAFPQWVYDFISFVNRENRLPTYSKETNLYSCFRDFKSNNSDWKNTDIGKFIIENAVIDSTFSIHKDISNIHCSNFVNFVNKHHRLPAFNKTERTLRLWFNNYIKRNKNDSQNPIMLRLKEAGCL